MEGASPRSMRILLRMQRVNGLPFADSRTMGKRLAKVRRLYKEFRKTFAAENPGFKRHPSFKED